MRVPSSSTRVPEGRSTDSSHCASAASAPINFSIRPAFAAIPPVFAARKSSSDTWRSSVARTLCTIT